MGQCEGTPCQELLQSVAQFNRGDWFECHETLEELWVGEKGELRDFYQGMLQLAVALHHWRNGNFKGALILLEGGGDLLARVAPVCLGVDAAALRGAAAAMHRELSDLGEARMEELAATFLLQVRLVPQLASADVRPEPQGKPTGSAGKTGKGSIA